jgi:hypothetical protein
MREDIQQLLDASANTSTPQANIGGEEKHRNERAEFRPNSAVIGVRGSCGGTRAGQAFGLGEGLGSETFFRWLKIWTMQAYLGRCHRGQDRATDHVMGRSSIWTHPHGRSAGTSKTSDGCPGLACCRASSVRFVRHPWPSTKLKNRERNQVTVIGSQTGTFVALSD